MVAFAKFAPLNNKLFRGARGWWAEKLDPFRQRPSEPDAFCAV